MDGKIVAICQLGAQFCTNSDGTLVSTGGEAHAIDLDRDMKLEDFKVEMSSMFDCDLSEFIIKYLLPSDMKTLITVSNDRELQRMVDFSTGSSTTEVFLLNQEDNKR